MKDPVDHILRPVLPWREASAITECGYDATKVKTISREEYFAREKELGRQRTAMLTCMTCASTAGRWGAWEDDPRQAIEREVTWEGSGRWAREDRGHRLLDELNAISRLIETHRSDFDQFVAEISTRRDWNEKKLAMQKRKT
jgi:hypothetical protein